MSRLTQVGPSAARIQRNFQTGSVSGDGKRFTTIACVPVLRPPVDLVIFDCDGVLVDSEPLSNAVLAEALTRAGLPTTPEQAVATYKGLHIRDVLDSAERALGHPLPLEFVPAFEDARAQVFQAELVPIAGAAQAVAAVRAAGVAVCVASQGKRSKTELTLALTGLRSLFAQDAVFSAHSVARAKPHPDLFLHAARTMNATPDRTTVVEDTVVGVTAAVAAGMRAIGYGADSDPDALRRAGAETIERLNELPVRLGLPDSPPPEDRQATMHPTAARLQERLHAMGLEISVRTAAASARTAAQAAAAIDCEVGQIVKSLVFLRDEEPVIVLCAGDHRVAAQRLGLTPASAEQARTATGFAIGGIPPLGHDRPLETIMDESLLRFDTVWAAGGTPETVFGIAPQVLAAAIPAVVVTDVSS